MKITTSILFAIILSINLHAQAPTKMSYQAVIRNASNVLVNNSIIGMRSSILQGSVSGTVVYAETYNPNPATNSNGLVSLEIGSGIASVGNFSLIDWANGPYFIKTETDITGGANYTITATKELLSVPYALHAANVPNYTGGQGIDILSNDIALAKQNANTGQVLKWDGLGWTPATDETGSSSYIQGQGIDLSNNTIALNKQNATMGQILKWDGAGWTPGTDNTGSSYLAGQGIDLSNNTIALAKQNAQIGQVLKWNGTAWAPGVDSSSNSWSVNGNNIYRNKGFVGIGTSNPAFPLDIKLANQPGIVRIMDDANDTLYRNPLVVGYYPSAKSGVGIQTSGGKSPFLFMDYDVYNPGSGHAGILAAGDNAGVVGTGEIGLLGIGSDGGRLYGKNVGMYVQGGNTAMIGFTPKALGIAADLWGEVWVEAGNPIIGYSANVNINSQISTYGESSENAGFFALYGPAGTANMINSNLTGKPNNNFFTILSGGNTQKAGMYLNNSNQGILFADVKNFRMKYPGKPGKEIWYASLEGPEAAAYVRGTAQLINGEAHIVFSQDFQIVGNANTMTVVLTPGSEDSKGLAVINKSDKGFTVKELFKGTGSYSFDWEVKCVRKGYEDYKVVRDEEETRIDGMNKKDRPKRSRESEKLRVKSE